MKTKIAGDIDEYIDGFPAPVHELLKQMRSVISKAAPAATEKISYAIPTFCLEGNLVHFAGYKNHIGFYPGAAPLVIFKKELSVYKTAKGSVQFPLDKKLPVALINRIVKYRVKANLEKARLKKK